MKAVQPAGVKSALRAAQALEIALAEVQRSHDGFLH